MADRPQSLTVERAKSLLRIAWQDGHASAYSLVWLRGNCPCATCREDRRAAVLATDALKLMSGPLPSAEVTAAELVGHYAVRFTWGDGHNTGIYAYAALRASCPCLQCNPNGAPPLLPDD